MKNNDIHVLIADSDESSAITLKNCLERGGYIINACINDGVDAINVIIKTNPDIVFLDEKLELINGIKVASYICSKGFDGIVILTSEKYDENISKSIHEHGIDGYIIKPVTEKFLIPWLYTKFKRVKDIKILGEEKRKLLLTLENKRFIEGANGIISSEMNVSIFEADKILTEKAEEKHMSKEELAKIFVSSQPT